MKQIDDVIDGLVKLDYDKWYELRGTDFLILRSLKSGGVVGLRLADEEDGESNIVLAMSIAPAYLAGMLRAFCVTFEVRDIN